MTHGGARVVNAGGTQPPDSNLERRVAAIEAVLPALATKADLAELRDELRAQQQELEERILQRLTLMQATLLADTRAIHSSLYRWMVATMLTMLIAFSGFFIGLGNLLLSHVPPVAAPQPQRMAPSALHVPRSPPATRMYGPVDSI